MKRAAFIINPASGIGGKWPLERCIEHFFDQQSGWRSELYYTTGPNDAFTTALRYKEEPFDLVVAVGGDGTINQVASALVHSPVPLGIIPCGSGNGLARHLHIPFSIPKAVALLQRCHIESIDSGSINERSFFCTAGIGFDASLAHRFNNAHIRGFFSYAALSAATYVNYHPEKYIIETGEQLLEREAFLITFANCAQWGYNTYISPSASATDGLLNMVVWKKTPKVKFPFVAARLPMHNIDHSHYVETISGVRFCVERPNEGWVHVDGEHIQMGKKLVVEVHPSSLRVITPP